MARQITSADKLEKMLNLSKVTAKEIDLQEVPNREKLLQIVNLPYQDLRIAVKGLIEQRNYWEKRVNDSTKNGFVTDIEAERNFQEMGAQLSTLENVLEKYQGIGRKQEAWKRIKKKLLTLGLVGAISTGTVFGSKNLAERIQHDRASRGTYFARFNEAIEALDYQKANQIKIEMYNSKLFDEDQRNWVRKQVCSIDENNVINSLEQQIIGLTSALKTGAKSYSDILEQAKKAKEYATKFSGKYQFKGIISKEELDKGLEEFFARYNDNFAVGDKVIISSSMEGKWSTHRLYGDYRAQRDSSIPIGSVGKIVYSPNKEGIYVEFFGSRPSECQKNWSDLKEYFDYGKNVMNYRSEELKKAPISEVQKERLERELYGLCDVLNKSAESTN